jgi:peptide/nickel transport system substrate-binding protein
MRGLKIGGFLLSIVVLAVLWAAPAALAEDTPRRGGVLRVALAGDPPSLDMHQEQTFLVIIPFSTVYNTLVQFDPHGYPNIIGDLAKAWTVSDDKKTWTFTLHQGVTFHDGSPLTSADVKASFDKIVSPPEGVVSPRKSYFQMIQSIAAPDPSTVVFHLHYASPSFLSMLAHPANFVYAKKYLDQDPNYYKQHAMGSGPFKLKEYVRGSTIEMVRNPTYWKQGLPYMDGIKYFLIKDDGARAKSIRADRTDVEFRGFAPSEVEGITSQMGNKVTVAYPGQPAHWGIAFNVDKKPFDDERVRKAMSLAIDRYDMAKTLAPLTSLDTPGGPIPPGAPWALSKEELQELPGFGKDHEANLREAKRLLAEAGYANGFKTVLTNRSIKLPYIDMGSVSAIGVEEGRHRGRASAGGERHLEQEPGKQGFRGPAGSHGHVGGG